MARYRPIKLPRGAKAKSLALEFGMIGTGIAEQLAAQGLRYTDTERFTIERAQECVHTLGALCIRGIITDGERRNAHKRLFKMIAKRVEPING